MTTTIKFEGNDYTLLRDAYIAGTNEAPFYTSLAVSSNNYIEGDVTDHYDLRGITIYKVLWEIMDQDCDDESNACDWENPESVEAV